MLDAKKPNRPSRLGRGLSSLLNTPVAVEPQAAPPAAAEPERTGDPGNTSSPSAPAKDAAGVTDHATAAASTSGTEAGEGLRYVPVAEIVPNRHQPRQHFDETALRTLAASIKRDGLMQPIVVRPTGGGEHPYELVAGERRWRAAQIAGLAVMPALVRELDERQTAELALIENLQREDLNAIERAEAFQRLAERFGLAHDEIADRVGLDRSTVANLIRLLGLAPAVQQLVRDDLLSMGQARALASVGDPAQQEALAKQAVREGMSVRDVEAAVRRATRPTEPKAAPEKPDRASHFTDLQQSIGRQLGTRVAIAPGRKKGTGKLTIEFYSIDQFDNLIEKLGVRVDE